jgi:hypothetical protein
MTKYTKKVADVEFIEADKIIAVGIEKNDGELKVELQDGSVYTIKNVRNSCIYPRKGDYLIRTNYPDDYRRVEQKEFFEQHYDEYMPVNEKKEMTANEILLLQNQIALIRLSLLARFSFLLAF